jgi:hypothetical protein
MIQEEQLGLDLLLGEVARQAKQVRDSPSIFTYTIYNSSGECNYNKCRVQCK